MKNILNKRLQTISAINGENEKIIDIGCDHGFLGMYLVQNRKKIKVISSDIHEGPLKKAQENLLKYHLEDKIILRLGNGLETIDDDIETVIISGMGGINIISILKDINSYPNVKKIILSPNNLFFTVRKNISKLNFKLIKETMVWEKGKYYPVMVYEKGREKYSFFFGKLDFNDSIVREYYKMVYDTNKNILEKLSWHKKLKKITLYWENYMIKERMKKWKGFKK